MNKTFSKPKLENCRCGCHEEQFIPNCVPDCIDLDINRSSQLIQEPIERNINQHSFHYNYDNPLFISQKENEIDNELNNNKYTKHNILLKEVKNQIERDNLNLSKKYDIRERAQAIREKIDSIFLMKKMNNKNMKKELNLRNNYEENKNDNFTPKFTFYDNLNFNKRERSSFDRTKFEKKINIENPRLRRLLSNVPRHEKNKSGKRQTDETAKLLFTNGLFRMKSFDGRNNFINKKKFNGYSSMIMPPNNINNGFHFMDKN